jgi:hypothetical protein
MWRKLKRIELVELRLRVSSCARVAARSIWSMTGYERCGPGLG